MSEKKWEIYERVAADLLNKFADHFGVGRFEGKQVVPGESGTKWEIDAKGCSDQEGSFLVVECKRYTKNGIDQAIAGSLAWSIKDTGGSGGLLVSPLGLQEGAKKIANHANIAEVVLDQDSTTTDYMMKFLDNVFLGFSDGLRLSISEKIEITVKDSNGNVVEKRTIKT